MSVTASLPASSSWPAVTVTVCAVLQFDVVNVSEVLSSVRSVPSWPDTVTVTSAVGCEFSATV